MPRVVSSLSLMDHEERERLQRLVVDLLLQNYSSGQIRFVVNQTGTDWFSTKDADGQVVGAVRVELNAQAVNRMIAAARQRIKDAVPDTLADELAVQLSVLRAVQQRAMRSTSPSAVNTVLRTSKQISRLLGLDAPSKTQSEVTVNAASKGTPESIPLAELVHTLLGAPAPTTPTKKPKG